MSQNLPKLKRLILRNFESFSCESEDFDFEFKNVKNLTIYVRNFGDSVGKLITNSFKNVETLKIFQENYNKAQSQTVEISGFEFGCEMFENLLQSCRKLVNFHVQELKINLEAFEANHNPVNLKVITRNVD